jgi:hypothetical protein
MCTGPEEGPAEEPFAPRRLDDPLDLSAGSAVEPMQKRRQQDPEEVG